MEFMALEINGAQCTCSVRLQIFSRFTFVFISMGFLMSIAASTEKKIDLQRTRKRKPHQISFGRSSELSAFVLIRFRSHEPKLDAHNEPLNSEQKTFTLT